MQRSVTFGKIEKGKKVRITPVHNVETPAMGLTYAKLVLKNARKTELQAIHVDALVDTGSNFLCVPPHIQFQLQLDQLTTKEVILADGSTKSVPYVGPVEMHFKNRSGFFGAIVLGDQVLLGAVPMEDMDLVVIPSTKTVDVNPANPNFACGIVK